MTDTTDDTTQVVKQDESQGKPGDDWVKKTQLIAAVNSATAGKEAAEREAAALRTRLAELEKKPDQKPPTRTELLQFVEKGDLSQEQADAIWEKQIKDAAVKAAAETTTRVLAGNAYQQQVETELRGYKELKGEAWQPGTPERARVEAEFAYLVQMGDDPSNRATEAKALRAAFGDLSTLRASTSARPGPSDTHEETGGHRPVGDGKGNSLKLSPEQKKYYEKGIESGRYKGWDDVKEELKYKKR